MKNKHVGYMIVGIAILFFFVVMSFNNALETIVSTSCTHGDSCPMRITLKTQKMVSYGLIGLLVLVGLVISYFMKDERVVLKDHVPKLTNEEKKHKLDNLDGAEKEIMQILLREEGSVYQSDIIKETQQTKVKVTRILDKLEGKGLIERKRRGMTNIIIAKNN